LSRSRLFARRDQPVLGARLIDGSNRGFRKPARFRCWRLTRPAARLAPGLPSARRKRRDGSEYRQLLGVLMNGRVFGVVGGDEALAPQDSEHLIVTTLAKAEESIGELFL